MRLLKLLLVLLACAAAVPAVAGTIEDAISAYDNGDYATAMRTPSTTSGSSTDKAKVYTKILWQRSYGTGKPPSRAAEAAAKAELEKKGYTGVKSLIRDPASNWPRL